MLFDLKILQVYSINLPGQVHAFGVDGQQGLGGGGETGLPC